MASVRSAPGYEGTLDPAALTYAVDNTISSTFTGNNYDGSYHTSLIPSTGAPGAAVTLVASGEVGLGAAGGWLAGRLEAIAADMKASVTSRGVVGFRYNTAGATPPLVGRGVQVDGTGLVTTPAGGARLATERGTVVSLDTVNGIAYVQL